MARTITAYMCNVDADYHLGEDSGGTALYPSVDDLKRHRACWSQCGVVEVEVTIGRVVIEGDL